MRLLQEVGFKVLLSAEFLGRHTFNVGGWQILPERPNEADFIIAREFAAKAYERFSSKPTYIFKLQKPFGYHQAIKAYQERPKPNKRGYTHPIRVTEQCSMCRDCETECPTQAFNAESGTSDPEICIECMHCLYICPDEVIEIDKRMKDVYADFLATWHVTESMMENKQSKIISESWEAAS
jgi:NAD-dependent dihydropyrimidine dehydrogenase PreA subunit